MVELWIPYGDVEVSVRVPDENLEWLVDPSEANSKSLDFAVSAIRSPLETKGLNELVKPDSKIAIAINCSPARTDIAKLLQLILEEVFSSGASSSEVEVMVAAGTSLASDDFLANLDLQLKGCKLTVSDPRKGKFVDVGATSFGTKVQLNRSFIESDVRVVVGDTYANWFYGFTGPWNVVLGMCSESTISQNGALALKRGAKKGPNLLQNGVVHLDAREAASMANIDLSLSIIPGRGGTIRAAFAGSAEKVYERSVEMARRICVFKTPKKKVDILLVGSGGFPFDSNLVSACDALFNFERAVDKDGRIVLVAECRDGPGEGAFFELLYRFKDAGSVLGEIRRRFTLEGYKAMKLIELREKHGISIVSAMPLLFSEKVLSFRTADTANEGLHNAFRFLGRESKIGVVVDGSSSVSVEEEES